jgi:preprotein translocase subunit SecA
MGKKHKRVSKRTKPDEYFAAGPIEMARFGKTTVMQSRATEAQHIAAQTKMQEMFPQVVTEIDALAMSIADQISRLPADRLLHRGWWEFAAIAITKGSAEVDETGALRMIDYVQSVIASVPPHNTQADDLSDADWARLQTDIRKLFEQITTQYQICLTATRRAVNPELDMALEEFRFRAECMWMHVRGKRYLPHERIALAELVAPHSEIFVKLFGINVPTLIDGLGKILDKLTRGAGDSMLALKQLHEDSKPHIEMLASMPEIESVEAFFEKLWSDPTLAARRDAVMGEVVGLDLFDVAKITGLPSALVDELTWSPGEEHTFFAPGDFAGWPLRIWPTMLRPFVRLKGRVLCFDMWSLFDNIYRALQRIVCRLEPSYQQTWNAHQKIVTEELPFVYFGKLLPGMRRFDSVNYLWKSGPGKPQWHECDGLITYDEHLFVIEVKAGAFTYTSPATDLAAHLASLKGLLAAPAAQGARFLDYLESAEEVIIADKSQIEIARIRRTDFRYITIVAITLDAFSDLAARAQHLKTVGIDVGARSVWALSIDDLRVCADLFENPLVFLHFVEQRMRAAQSNRVDLDDEMDHIGLYLVQNNYALFASEFNLSAKDKLNFNGFRTPVDEFYAAMVHGEPAISPRQKMPARIAELIDVLSKSEKVGRSQLASFILDAGGDLRDTIANGIDNQLEGNKRLRRQRPLLHSGEHAFTICTSSPEVPRDAAWATEYARSLVAANSEHNRLLIELEYDVHSILKDIHWQYVSLSGLAPANVAFAHAEGQRLKRNRITRAREEGKISVNAPCPCGSGRKYKKCCRP